MSIVINKSSVLYASLDQIRDANKVRDGIRPAPLGQSRGAHLPIGSGRLAAKLSEAGITATPRRAKGGRFVATVPMKGLGWAKVNPSR